MYRYLHIRLPVLIALLTCFTAFVLSMLVLFAGSTPNFVFNGYLVLYDTAYATYSSRNSSRPAPGIRDFYAFYLLSVCYGDWPIDPSTLYNTNDNSLTRPMSTMSNIACERKPFAYKITLSDYISTRSSSYISINSGYSIRGRSPYSYSVAWVIGIGLSGLALCLIPWCLRGKFRGNRYAHYLAFAASLALMVGAICATVEASLLKNYIYSNDASSIYGSVLWLAMVWAAVGCMYVAWFAEFLEFALQRWTKPGERINLANVPPDVPWCSCGDDGGLKPPYS